ncbi:MAG: hypothetical protein MHMPM18_005093, partial [Marteilia pararefringens]
RNSLSDYFERLQLNQSHSKYHHHYNLHQNPLNSPHHFRKLCLILTDLAFQNMSLIFAEVALYNLSLNLTDLALQKFQHSLNPLSNQLHFWLDTILYTARLP